MFFYLVKSHGSPLKKQYNLPHAAVWCYEIKWHSVRRDTECPLSIITTQWFLLEDWACSLHLQDVTQYDSYVKVGMSVL